MPGRLIAIGDIHGCLAALQAVVAAIGPQPEDTLVALGDFVDRGPDSRGVIDELLDLGHRCNLVPILGNHDEMMLKICLGETERLEEWLGFGGRATWLSYDRKVPEGVPREHVEFLRNCRAYYETQQHFFVHGNYLPYVPLAQQPAQVLRWLSLKIRIPDPHVSGKIAIMGHTSQKNGEIINFGYLQCIDTYCYGTGWLTALDVLGGQVWQVDKHGRSRA